MAYADLLTASPVSAIDVMEESQPPSPSYGPPNNFGEVAPGIYRSSFPKEPNFDHLAQLELKTILYAYSSWRFLEDIDVYRTLVSEKEDPQYLKFIASKNIKHHQIPIPPNKEAFDAIPIQAMTEALSLVCDTRNYPILIHCNKGKVCFCFFEPALLMPTCWQHRTGCVVGCYRKMSDWKIDAILDEYRHYAGLKARSLDEKYISDFDKYGMAMRLNDIVYQLARDNYGFLTPPSSDRSFKDSDSKAQGYATRSIPFG